MTLRPSFRLHPYQRQVLDCIACEYGIPLRSVKRVLDTRPPRFNTQRLAAKLARTLHDKTP